MTTRFALYLLPDLVEPAVYLGDLGGLSPAPALHLPIAAGVPLTAAGAGWLLAGHELESLARQPIE